MRLERELIKRLDAV